MIFGKGERRCTCRTSSENLTKSAGIAAFWQGLFYSWLASRASFSLLRRLQICFTARRLIMAEITTLLSDGKFLFSAEEKAQIESELETLKKRIAIVTHPENPENIAKERTIHVIQKENDMKKNKTIIKNFAFDDYKETPYVNPIGTVIDDNSFRLQRIGCILTF